jgi:hypothetical protein
MHTQPAGVEDGGAAAAAAAAWPRTSFRIPPVVSDIDVPWQSNEEWCNFGRGSILVLYSSGGVFILDLHKASFVWASLTPGFIPADEILYK